MAFARVLLHRPDIIVLDEATAALDTPTQNRLMELLFQEFKDATVVSIGHRPGLAAFHQRKILLKHDCGGAKLVRDVYRLPEHRRLRDLMEGGTFRGALPEAEALNPRTSEALSIH